MTDYYSIAKKISSDSCRVLLDSPMSRQTSFKAGGNASIIAFPDSADALLHILKCAKESDIKAFVIGNGSNLLIKDSGIEGIVIKLTALTEHLEINGNEIKCSAGVQLTKLCTFAYEHSLTGLEFAYGIPATVGGAVYMNAGAYGGEMKDVLTEVCHITPELRSECVAAKELGFGYRTSFYEKNEGYIVTEAHFKLKKGNKTEIKAKMDELLSRRKEKQPLEYASAGSTFKRPEGYFAAKLIEDAGLKGFQIGGARVSEKHAGFIVNTGGATAAEVLAVEDHIKNTVFALYGVMLEREVRVIE